MIYTKAVEMLLYLGFSFTGFLFGGFGLSGGVNPFCSGFGFCFLSDTAPSLIV